MTNLSVTSVMAYLLSTSIKKHIGNDHKLSENINKLCRAWWSSSLQSMMEQDICGQENMLPYILLRICIPPRFEHDYKVRGRIVAFCRGIYIVSTSFDNLHGKITGPKGFLDIMSYVQL